MFLDLAYRYMEEVIENTFSLLSFHHEHGSPGTERVLEPVHLLALLDVKATWFKKWMVCMPTVSDLHRLNFCMNRCVCVLHFNDLHPLLFILHSVTYIFSGFLLASASLSAWLLQQGCDSQTPGEKIQVCGEWFTQ